MINTSIENWRPRVPELACDIFDSTYDGVPFTAASLVGKVSDLRGYAPRTQLDIIRMACRELVNQSAPDNRLLRKHGGRFIWDTSADVSTVTVVIDKAPA